MVQPCTIDNELRIETESEVFVIPIRAEVLTEEGFGAWEVRCSEIVIRTDPLSAIESMGLRGICSGI